MKLLKTVARIVLLAIFLVTSTPGILSVNAASLSALSNTMSSLKQSALSNHDILFTTPTGVGSGGIITLTFESDFSIPVGLTFTDVDVLDDGVQATLAAAPSGATWGVVRTSSTVLTLTNGSTVVAGGSIVRIRIGTNAVHQTTGVQQITNPTTTGPKTVTIAGSFGDTGSITMQIITDDAVAVSATVQQSISFAISANTIAFGTLDSAAARYANTSTGSASETVAHTLAVGTNATTGYTITVQGATLTSQQNGSNTITANGSSPVASSTGSEQFGIYTTKAGGTNGTIDPTYATGSSFGYDGTAGAAAVFATGTTATNTETYSLRYIANISPLTEAGTYTTSLTYVATANF